MPTADSDDVRITLASQALTQATIRAAELLDLNRQTLAQILGLSLASVSKISRQEVLLQPETPVWNNAVLFTQLFRTLHALVGGRDALARAWLRNPNLELGTVPAEMLLRTDGLARVVNYVNAALVRA